MQCRKSVRVYSSNEESLMHIIACFGFFLSFLFFFGKVLQKQVCNLYQRILSSSEVPGKHKMPGIWGDGDLLYIYLNILLPCLKWQERAGWGRGVFPHAQGCEEPFFRPSGKAFLLGKRLTCLILGRSDLFMAPKGRT